MIITSVVFKLDKFPEFRLDYGNLEEKVKQKGKINLRNIRETIIEVRSSKLPDFHQLGNAGSFFKNPVVNDNIANKLKEQYPDIPVYLSDAGMTKLAAGWLIEKAGWRGFRTGDAGVHDKQALVLVNYGNATGLEILSLADKISYSVYKIFGIELEKKVNVV